MFKTYLRSLSQPHFSISLFLVASVCFRNSPQTYLLLEYFVDFRAFELLIKFPFFVFLFLSPLFTFKCSPREKRTA